MLARRCVWHTGPLVSRIREPKLHHDRVAFSTNASDISKGRHFFESIAAEMGFGTKEQWYFIPRKRLSKADGKEALSLALRRSLPGALQTLFPDHDWQLWKFPNVPAAEWHNDDNIIKFLRYLESKWGIVSPEGWYKVKVGDITREGGRALLQANDWKMARLLAKLYPEHSWVLWKFQKVPVSFWADITNQRELLDSVGRDIGVKTLEDWYKIPLSKITSSLGATFVYHRYRGSKIKLLQTVYPEFAWDYSKFSKKKNVHWTDISRQRQAFDEAFTTLGLSKMEDWYDVTSTRGSRKAVNAFSILSTQYNQSMFLGLSAIYPEHEWLPWRFRKAPQGYWDSPQNQKLFLDHVMTQLKMTSYDDWYSVPVRKVRELGGAGLFTKHSLREILPRAYPAHKWDPMGFKQRRPTTPKPANELAI